MNEWYIHFRLGHIETDFSVNCLLAPDQHLREADHGNHRQHGHRAGASHLSFLLRSEVGTRPDSLALSVDAFWFRRMS